MTAALFAVGCIGLFGGGTPLMKRGAISRFNAIQALKEITAPRSHVIRLESFAERRNLPNTPRATSTQGLHHAPPATRNYFS